MKILLVEDEIIIAKDIERFLSKEGYTIINIVTSGEHAVESVNENPPDLILMDIKLKGNMDGIEAAEIINGQFNIPIIYLTSYKDEQTLLRAKITEPYGYIIKPFDPRELKIFIDIAFYKHKTNEKIKEGKDWLTAILKSIGEGVIAAGPDGTVEFMNPVAEGLTGWKENEIREKQLKDILKIFNGKRENIFPELLSEIFQRSISKEQNNLFLMNKNGNRIPIDLYGYPIVKENKKILGVVITFRDITEKNAAESALKESEKRFRTLYESSPLGIAILDENGDYIQGNKSLQKILGRDEEEIVSANFRDFTFEDDLDISNSFFERVVKGEINSAEFEKRYFKKDRSIVWVNITLSVIKNEQDKFLNLVVIISDITESKKASDKIREGEERFRQLAENIRDVFYVTDKNLSKIFYVSPAFEEIWGSPCQSLYSSIDLWKNSIFIEDRDFLFNEISKLPGTEGFDIEYRIVRPDRKIRWVRDRISPIKDYKGFTFRYAGIVEDITEQKSAEEQVKTLSYAVQQNPALIMITNAKGDIEYINTKFSAVTGYSLEEVRGKNPRILKSGYTNPEEYKILWKTINAGGEWRGDFYNRKKNGEFYWESALIAPIKNRNGEITHFLAVKEDITERKKQEEQLIIAKEQAEKSDKLKSEFLAQMSHEIRTPLNNILTYTSLLKEEMEDKLPSGLEPAFRVINSSALRLIRTIDLILNLSKIQTGNFEIYFEKIDLDYDILYELVLEFYKRAAEKNIKLNYKNAAENSLILGDNYTVSQVFVNLIDNAIKYTNEGEVNIILYNNSENDVCVDITDSGIGINSEFLPILFEPFTQEDNSAVRNYEGTGLGLALVKKYVEINKAKILVKSKKNKGTTFTLIFNSLRN